MKHTLLKNIPIPEQESIWDKCLRWFFAYPNARIGITELAKSLHSSKTATKQAIESLVREQFLNKESIGKAWLLFANQKHSFFTSKKIAYNLQTVYESGIVDAVYKVVPSPRAIILFGSYRWGTDIEESDIDIAVEIINHQDFKIQPLGIIELAGYRKKIMINLHIFSRNKIDLNLFANIANGIVLDGFLEVKT